MIHQNDTLWPLSLLQRFLVFFPPKTGCRLKIVLPSFPARVVRGELHLWVEKHLQINFSKDIWLYSGQSYWGRFCHMVSHWEDRNMITTILLFELTVASHQRVTVKKECRSQRGDPQMFILGDLTRVAWQGKEGERSQMIGWDPKTEVGTPSRQRK